MLGWLAAGYRCVTRPVVLASLQIFIGDAVLLELAVEGGLADAEEAGGHELIAVEVAQRGEDGLLFHLGYGTDLYGEGRFGLDCGVAMFQLGAGVLELRGQIAEV